MKASIAASIFLDEGSPRTLAKRQATRVDFEYYAQSVYGLNATADVYNSSTFCVQRHGSPVSIVVLSDPLHYAHEYFCSRSDEYSWQAGGGSPGCCFIPKAQLALLVVGSHDSRLPQHLPPLGCSDVVSYPQPSHRFGSFNKSLQESRPW